MIGRTLSHYLIERPLGAGGMGAVYLARDLALSRPVAIKVVTDQLDASLRGRLLREAEAGARLQHPAIATFFESGEAGGVAFIAMEYVRGVTLRDRLGSGALPVGQALSIGSALLEALNHAHAAGLLHRDIKPENIMLTDEGTVKLLDFGLAKALASGAGHDGGTMTNLTGERVLGTIGYMSPEQLRGEVLDARSDLFAVGAVLYEMLCGRPAFPGSSPTERIAAILSRDPDPLSGPGLLPRLHEIVRRALNRDRQARYASAAALLSDLRALSSGEAPAATALQTLAVLDLQNLSGRAEDDWIGSGIAESLTADLTRVPGMAVVSRARVLKAARPGPGEAPRDALEVGSLLGCRWVLSGSFQRMGSAVRLTTHLSEVATGQTVAGEKLDGLMDGIFEMQDKLSCAIAAGLNLRLPTPATGADAGRDLDAFEYFSRGRRLFHRLEKGSFDQARELYERAIARQPGHAAALSGLAGLHAMRFTFTTDPRELDTAADYARRAIASDPHLADPHVWLGYTLMRQGRADEALEEERLATDQDSDNAYAPYFAGCICQFYQRPAEAVPWFQLAVARDASHGFAWLGLGWAHLSQGRLDESRWCVERAIALEHTTGPGPTAGARAYLGECLRLAGRLDEARTDALAGLEAVEQSDHMYRDTFRCVALGTLARTALDQGDTAAARTALRQVLAHVNGRERTLGGGYFVVQALAGLARSGESDALLDDAFRLYRERARFSFDTIWTGDEPTTLVELGRSAVALGRDEGQGLIKQAAEHGSFEARRLLGLSLGATSP